MGLNIAYQLRRRSPDLSVLVLERAPALGAGSSGYSTGFQRAYYSFDETMAWVASNSELVGDGYALSKEAVCYYTVRRSAASLARGVRMNSICPGVTNTPIAGDFVAGLGADVIDRAIASAGRIAQPHEMAPAILFLADELSSSFISGVNLTIDRGVKAARITGQS